MSIDLTPLAGSPDLVEEDASNLRLDAMQLGALQELLAMLFIDGSGNAVQGLQHRIDKAAFAVQGVFENYVGAFRCLETFGPELREAQKLFDDALERRHGAIADVNTHGERRQRLLSAADQLRSSDAPATAVGQVENEAYHANIALLSAQGRLDEAESDLITARKKYDAAAADANAQLSLLDQMCIDTGAFISQIATELGAGGYSPSVVSSNGTPEQRKSDGGVDFSGAYPDLLFAPVTGYAAGSAWVHKNSILKANGVAQWKPYNTLDRSSTGVFTQEQTRALRSIYGPTAGQARSNFAMGPRAGTVVTNGLSVAGATWTFYDTYKNSDTKYWYLAPEDRKDWGTMEASSVAAGSAAGSTAAAAGAACGPLVVFCAPAFGVAGGMAGGYMAEQAFKHGTHDARTTLAVDHFVSTHPGTTVSNGKVYFEGEPVGYFGIYDD